MRTVDFTRQFRRDKKLLEKQGKDFTKFDRTVELLIAGERPPRELNDHQLSGNMSQYRELHIAPDWLLIYRLFDGGGKIVFTRTGAHDDVL